MRISIVSRIVAAFSVALVVLLVVGVSAYFNLQASRANEESVLHTLDLLETKEQLFGSVMDLQSSARGYALTGDAYFADRIDEVSEEIGRTVEALYSLTAGSPAQQGRLERLEPLIAGRVAAAHRTLELRRQVGSADDEQLLEVVREGTAIGQAIREILGEVEAAGRRLLEERRAQAEAAGRATTATLVYGTLTAFLLVAALTLALTRSIRVPLRALGEGAGRIAAGEYGHRVSVASEDEVGDLAALFNDMATQVAQRQEALADDSWLKTNLARFSRLLEGQRDAAALSAAVLSRLADLLEIPHAVLYRPQAHAGGTRLFRQAAYAAHAAPAYIESGQGLVGQCFLEKRRIVASELPADYVRIGSALGEAAPTAVAVLPAVLNGEVEAVLELATFRPFTELQLSLLDQLAESLAVVLHTIEASTRTEELLKESRTLSLALEERQRELAVRNDELEAQAERLRQSEQLLQQQQEELKQANEELEQTNEELQQTNAEMEERATQLYEQKIALEEANREVETARGVLEEQSQQLAQTSRYKSEFLANMSHELRTPLNSLLILSKVLADNEDSTLSPKQVQYARTINASGHDLLDLINDILDLSKIEAGAADLELSQVRCRDLMDFLENTFRHVAENKGLEFVIEVQEGVPELLHTDERRLQQVMKNLLSNAFKFTERGRVSLVVRPADAVGEREMIAFAVTDTGIGIAPERQQVIFEAFRQAESGTARKYGGTGLGLSISRELARLLGGTLQVQSKEGEGSTFTLCLPAQADAAAVESARALPARPKLPAKAALSRTQLEDLGFPDAQVEAQPQEDDRGALGPGDLVLLIVEDDKHFAQVLAGFAREKGFKAVIARTAASGIGLAKRLRPTAITLDLILPDSDGRVVLDVLKHDPVTRHIPVHVISVEEERERMLRQGAVSYLQKPVTREALENALNDIIEFVNRPLKNLLIVEDDPAQRSGIVELIGNGDVHSTAVGTAREALAALEERRFDCMVVDLGLPDQSGLDLLEEIRRRHGGRSPPVIVYTARSLTRQEETELRRLSEAIILKDVRSPERLLDETALFLHRVQARLPDAKRRLIEQGQREDAVLSGRKVLVVDDDVRNIFAITTALESCRMQVLYAESGRGALDLMHKQQNIDVVLMDVMMPEMDGFEATRIIRSMDAYRRMPIIMVTAKAMKGDREKCLAAGASDYITKPVDMDQLRSLLRVWLYR